MFPGLWLDPPALRARDLARVFEVMRAGAQGPEHDAFVERLADCKH